MTDNEFIKMEADDRPILWSDIKGYEGFYRVSTDGQVQSVERVREYLNATIKSRILRQSPNPKGYLMVKLYKDGDKKTFPVHRLVAQAFIPNPQNKPQIDHIDGNTKNNNVTNLRWATNKENSNNPVTFVNRIGRPSHLKGKKGALHPSFGRRGALCANSKSIISVSTTDFSLTHYENASFTEQELSYNTIRNRCHDMSFTPYHGRWWFNTTDWNDNVKGEIIRKHINYKHSAL